MKLTTGVTVGLFLLAALAVSSCTTATPVTAPAVVYISDFDLEIAPIRQPGPSFPKALPLSQRLGYGRPKIEPTPEQRLRALVGLMSRSLLDDLQKAGIAAQRLPPGAPLPSSGWLVRGAFLDVDADGRLRRPVELGAHSTPEIVAAIDQFGAGTPQPLYTTARSVQSGKFPGAVVTLNPKIALGRYLLTPREPERNVMAAAEDIANQVKLRLPAGTPHS
jgi:hypothetical protein